jgi:hypothetical protein
MVKQVYNYAALFKSKYCYFYANVIAINKMYSYNVCDKIFGRFYVTEQNTL